jgi:elongation factor P
MINVTELRPGNYFEDEGALYQVLDILLNKTAMRKMVAKIKVKNLRTGAIFELARNSGYGVEEVRLDKKNMQYLYDAGETLCFMDGKTFEQIELPKANLQNEIPYLAPNGEVIIVSITTKSSGFSFPPKSLLTVTECEPAVKGDTINSAMKDAVLETGYKLRVPLFR